jgi:hypothetical protein
LCFVSGFTLIHSGECAKSNGCACPFIKAPVCGTDGVTIKTFANQCQMECEGKFNTVGGVEI